MLSVRAAPNVQGQLPLVFGLAATAAVGFAVVGAVFQHVALGVVALVLLVGLAVFGWSVAAACRTEVPVALAVSAAAFAPVLYGDIFSQIQNAIIGFFQGIWNGVQAFFGQIFQAIANVIVAIFQAPINAINSSWVNFQNSLAGFGPLAPLITAAMVGLVFVVAAFFIWLIVKLSISETEQGAEEVEEGV